MYRVYYTCADNTVYLVHTTTDTVLLGFKLLVRTLTLHLDAYLTLYGIPLVTLTYRNIQQLTKSTPIVLM